MKPRAARIAADLTNRVGGIAVDVAKAEMLKAGAAGDQSEMDLWASVCALLAGLR